MMTQISETLSLIATSFGFYPNLPIKVAFGVIITQLLIISVMTLSLMLMNKNSK